MAKNRFRDQTVWRMFLIVFAAICLRCPLARGQISKSVIWSKDLQSFVDLYEDPRFAGYREKIFDAEQEEALEAKYIRGKVLKVSYYEETNLIMFYDNDTKLTGLYGETWNLLADYLDFTLVPVKCKDREFGVRLENGSYSGLMGMLDRDEIQVILRVGYYNFRADILDYTIPIYNTKYRLYIRPEYTYDNRWMATVFTRLTWYTIVVLFLILGVAGYVFQNKKCQNSKRNRKVRKSSKYFSLADHVFYTYSVMCGQGYLPDDFHSQNKILSLSKAMFAWLVLIAFSSNLIYQMTNRTVTLPFSNFQTLCEHTDYNVIAFRGSMIYQNLMENHKKSEKAHFWERIHFVDKPYIMYEKVCQKDKNFAMLENEEKTHIRSKGWCSLIPVGKSYYQSWIGFGVTKGFRYKSVIDKSIIKLHEVGLIDFLQYRWMNTKRKQKRRSQFKMIDMQQVYLIFIIPFAGIVFSLVIFLFENVVFICKKKCR